MRRKKTVRVLSPETFAVWSRAEMRDYFRLYLMIEKTWSGPRTKDRRDLIGVITVREQRKRRGAPLLPELVSRGLVVVR